mmetsp:Transcript_26468/g.50742  ORF Transcript_26468/g.50742 Transcript_26468/m.50742 type:complete len:594 (+) Transcript_26468:2-1783(+)
MAHESVCKMRSRTSTALLFSCLLLSIHPLRAERGDRIRAACDKSRNLHQMHTNIELQPKSSLKDMEKKMQEMQEDMKEAFDHVNAAATHVPPRPVDQHELTYPFNVSFSSFMEGTGGPYRSEESCEQLQQEFKHLAHKIWFGREKIDSLMNTFFPDWYPDAAFLAKNVKLLHRTQKLAARSANLLKTMMDAKECKWAKETENVKKSRAGQQLAYVMNKANPGLQKAQEQLRVEMFLAEGDAKKQAEAFQSFISASMGSFGSASVSSLHVKTANLNEDLGTDKVEEALQKEQQEAKKLASDNEDEENEETVQKNVLPKVYWKPVAWGMKCLKDDRVLQLNLENIEGDSVVKRCLKAQELNEKCSKSQFYVNDKEDCWCTTQGNTCSIREANIRASKDPSNGHTLYERTERQTWETQSLVEVSSNTPPVATLPEAWQVPMEPMIPEGEATDSTSGLAMQSALAEMQRRSLLKDGCEGPAAILCFIAAVVMLAILILWLILLIFTCGVILLAIVVWLIGLIKCILQFLFEWLGYLASSIVGGGDKPTFDWDACLQPWWLVRGQDQTGNLMIGCLCVLALPGMASSDAVMFGLHPCR